MTAPVASVPSVLTNSIDISAIESLLDEMSLEAKVGQLFMVFFTGAEVSPHLRRMIVDYQVGGLILYSIAGNLETLPQIRQLVAQSQSLASIPLLVSIDQEGGPVVRLPAPATHFPSAMMIAATGSLDWAGQMAAATALELRALGINVNFAPVVDVNSNPANPIIGIRSFGSDPGLVSRFGVATLQGYQQTGVIPCPKHFPGHGDTDLDSHFGLPTIHRSVAELQAMDWIPFQQTIQAGAEMIMTAHVQIPALADKPATLSPDILQGWLREQLGFEGVIITDSLTMGALSESYPPAQAAVMAFWAGCDILLFGADRGFGPEVQPLAYEHLLELVKQGSIPLERLDQSVRRILALKARYGLLSTETLASSPQPPLDVIGSPAHQTLALNIARQGITAIGDPWVPIQLAQSLLIVLPSEVSHLQQLFRTLYPQATLGLLAAEDEGSQTQGLATLAQTYDHVIVGLWQVARHPNQLNLINLMTNGIPTQNCLWLVMGSPYDRLYLAESSRALILYGLTPSTLTAMGEILTSSPAFKA
ncbi:MAG: glycoside hydrolase family 3 protein, partial [Cyanophyceae cyanobacterium]